MESENKDTIREEPTQEQLEEAQKDPSKVIVERTTGEKAILTRMRG